MAPQSTQTPPQSLLTATPILRPKWDLPVTIAAFVGWYVTFHSRGSLIALSCSENPSSCHPETLNQVDRWGLVNDYHWLSDHLSFWTQDGAGVFAVICIFWFSINRRVIWAQILLLIQATFLNGLINESLRLVIQRPRPFVYLNPIGQGGAVDHYTSFYSGHTSFAALASTVATLSALNSRPRVRLLVTILGLFLTISTGAFRVLAGRHFITDVAFGALAGVAIALTVNSLHRETRHADSKL